MDNFNLVQEKENPLFKRKEIVFTISSKITPSNSEVGNFISEKFSAPLEAIKIKNILGKFGSNQFTISTNIYKSKEEKEEIERKRKKDEALVKKVEEVQPDEPVQDQPSEENKEEAKE